MTAADRIEFKSVEPDSVRVFEQDDGDLLIEGFAAVFSGEDRQGEQFSPLAFGNAIDDFLSGPAALVHHHKTDRPLGKVLRAELRPEGVWVRCRVDRQPLSSPLRYLYEQVRKGTLSAFSIGGAFARSVIGGKRRITGLDWHELSITSTPVMAYGTSFAVVAGKALGSDAAGGIELEELEAFVADLGYITALTGLHAALDRLGRAL